MGTGVAGLPYGMVVTEDHPDGSVSDERVCASSDIFFVSRHEDQ